MPARSARAAEVRRVLLLTLLANLFFPWGVAEANSAAEAGRPSGSPWLTNAR